MARKNTKTSSSNIDLKVGMIFLNPDSIYPQIMILSEKVISLSDDNIRECVGWNDERCRRFDTAESKLKSLKLVEQLDSDYVVEYVLKNKINEWEDPKPPK